MRVVAPLVASRTIWVVERCFGTILEIGGNAGHVFRNTGLNVTLLDINEFEKCEFPQVVADAHALPFHDNSFDCCVLAEILEHVHNPILVLKEAVRVARRRVLVSVPDPQRTAPQFHPFRTVDMAMRQRKMTMEEMVQEGNPTMTTMRNLEQFFHNRWYTREMLESQLKYVGLPYQIEIAKGSAKTHDLGWSHFCAVITKENHA